MSDLGEPFDTYAAHLLACDDAGRKSLAACVDNNAAKAIDAEFEVEKARGELLDFELDQANRFLLGFRLAVKWYPNDVLPLLDELQRLREESEEAYLKLWRVER